MMNNSQWTIIFGQLAGQGATLLVYLVGLILAGVWWRRAPRAALYAMIGCGILLFTTVAATFAQAYIINNRGGAPVASISQTLLVIAVAGSILRAAGVALLLAGVFTGRPRLAEMSGFEVQAPPPRPPLR